MLLCPGCLPKLQHAVGNDPVARHEKLRRLRGAKDLVTEAGWVGRRMEWIGRQAACGEWGAGPR